MFMKILKWILGKFGNL